MALRTGRHEGKGRPILPPMPYRFVASLNDDDLKAVFAYLQSIPAIHNKVPSPIDPPEETRTEAVNGAARRGLALALTLGLAAALAVRSLAAPALPERLSDTGLYLPGTLTVDPRNRAFSPQYPLWTDGAHKSRWIQLPAGGRITARDADTWEFPVGTRLWKEFAFDGRKVETRMLWRATADAWSYAAYAWNEAQTDATLVPAEGLADVVEVAPGKRHSVPSRDDCRACHDNGGCGRPRVHGAAALDRSRSGGAARRAAAARDDHAADAARRAPDRHAAAGALRAPAAHPRRSADASRPGLPVGELRPLSQRRQHHRHGALPAADAGLRGRGAGRRGDRRAGGAHHEVGPPAQRAGHDVGGEAGRARSQRAVRADALAAAVVTDAAARHHRPRPRRDRSGVGVDRRARSA